MNKKGFTLIEALIYIFVFSLIFALVFSFLIWIFNYNIKSQIYLESLLNLNMVINYISEIVMFSDSIYHPTSSSTQLSLEKDGFYMDFYLCGNNLCFKKEFQEPIVLMADVDHLNFDFIEEDGVNISLNKLNNTIFLR